ncbi:MAG: DUF1501 domain-containing protein [Planctomycetia bacterium]|nr:DUF1501 domain-containing protein [Planctomycetia bacterium]
MNLGCQSFRNSLNRREMLQVGGVGLFGMTWANLFQAQAQAAAASKATAKQVIFIWLHGGPPHQDTFDMKPDAPADVRGPFKPIQTVVPGLEVCEHLPRLAKLANKYSVLRSVHSKGYPEAGDHHAGLSWKTGNPRGLRGTPKYPMIGCVTSKLLPTPKEVPSFVALGNINSHATGLSENFLGPAYDPLSIPDDRRDDQTERMLTPPQLDLAGFDRNVDMLRSLEQQIRRQDAASPIIEGLDRFQQKAFDLLRAPKLREALDLEKEPAKNRERYGCQIQHYGNTNIKGNYHCRKVLMARRLIEAGVPFVYVDFAYWDWHSGNGLDKALPDLACLDAALPSLLEDLDARGLLENTMVVALGEMGRTPKVGQGKPYGREHWAAAQFVLVAGGGFQSGQVVGATDAHAAYVKDKDYKIASLGKTLYHLLGIDPDHELLTPDNRPLKLITEDVPLIKEVIA